MMEMTIVGMPTGRIWLRRLVGDYGADDVSGEVVRIILIDADRVHRRTWLK